jgi:uncharacterized protein (TIGR02646 family)
VIHIIRSPSPAILLRRGRRATEELKTAFEAATDKYLTGEWTFREEFDSTIYGDPSVKDALRAAQHGKCAFCESSFGHVAYGDVEHFRPKAGYKQRPEDGLGRPGYYWLAYEWGNLFYSCQLCNQRFKQNLFPLANPHRRAKSHRDDIALENPLLLDPAMYDPAQFLSFQSEVVYPLENNPIGQTTIEILGLNRGELTERRRQHLRSIRWLAELLRSYAERLAAPDVPPNLQSQFEKLKRDWESLTHDTAEYAAMARAACAASPS